MKKRIIISLFSFLIMLLPITVDAASGSQSVTGPGQVVVGNNITVTVSAYSASGLGAWQANVSNSDNLELVGTNTKDGGRAILWWTENGAASTSVSYTFTFRAKSSGTATISVSGFGTTVDEEIIDLSNGSKSISIITQAQLEASYSKNNNLKNLEVEGYEIEPEFSKDKLEYSVIVPEGTEKINIIATREDGSASVSGAGEQEVSEGGNKFEIVVRAENGSEKKYTLNVEVKDKDPINVRVDGKKYTVVKLASLLKKPENFEEKKIKIEGKEVAAFYNKNADITVVGLKNSKGDISLFIYDNGKYQPYNEIKSGSLVVLPKEIKNILDGYKKHICKLQNKEVECLSKKSGDRFRLIYGMNIKNKEEGFFVYDTKDDTLIKFDEKEFNALTKQNKLLFYAGALFGGIALISLLSLAIMASKKGKKKALIEEPIIEEKENLIEENTVEKPKVKKRISKKEKKIEEDPIKEEIPEEKAPEKEEKIEEPLEKEETEVYDIFEEEHTKKTRGRKK